MPTNITDLSVAGVLKWIAILLACLQTFLGVRAFVTRQAQPSRYEIVSGEAAIRIGWQHLGFAVLFAFVAFGFWFFWQRHED